MFATLLAEFGRTYGLENLVLDEYNACSLMLDDVVVNVELDPDGEELSLYSSIGTLRSPAGPELLGKLLEANYLYRWTDGAALGWESKSGNLAVCKRVSARLLDAAGFTRLLESFANVAAAWTQMFRELHAAGSQEQLDSIGLTMRV